MKNQANAREKGAEKLAAVSARAVRRAIAFTSDGEILRGWLYLPERMPAGKKIPGIVTANAMTGVKEINLPEYARRFAEAGFEPSPSTWRTCPS